MPPLVVSMGEPAGIGPELCARLLDMPGLPPLVIIGDRELLSARAAAAGIRYRAGEYQPEDGPAQSPAAAVWHLPLPRAVAPGEPHPDNADYVLQQLQRAVDGCLTGRFAALLTAPVSKEVILAAGAAFTGQTEYVAACAAAAAPVMLLASPTMRVALLTTHLPLAQVAAAVTEERLLAVLTTLTETLPRYFQTASPPHIRVCGLNPHAGEGGYLGAEEQRVLQPALTEARARGMNVTGPAAADRLLATSSNENCDCVLAMYHDQGLPVVKRSNLERTINVTLGLPFLRVSPDHGVALDIAAAAGTANPLSMQTAALFAARYVTGGAFR